MVKAHAEWHEISKKLQTIVCVCHFVCAFNTWLSSTTQTQNAVFFERNLPRVRNAQMSIKSFCPLNCVSLPPFPEKVSILRIFY